MYLIRLRIMTSKENMTISIDKALKKKIQSIAKSAGVNVSWLVNMYFAHIANTGEINLQLSAPKRVSLWLDKAISFDEFNSLLDK